MKRWPVVRHIRYVYHHIQIERWYRLWAKLGRHDMNKSKDLEYLARIWKGTDYD